MELPVAPTFFVVSGMEECSSDAWSGPGAHAGRRQRDFLASLPLLGGGLESWSRGMWLFRAPYDC